MATSDNPAGPVCETIGTGGPSRPGGPQPPGLVMPAEGEALLEDAEAGAIPQIQPLLEKLRELSGAPRTHILLAAMPKTASTFIRNALMAATGFRRHPLVACYGRQEQDIYVPALAQGMKFDTVEHQHVRATGANRALLLAAGIRPVVLVRDLADILVSLRDHYARESVALPVAFFDETYWDLNEETQLDALIDVACPWFVNFHVSWYRACRDRIIRALWIRYEDFLADNVGCLKRILSFNGLRVDGERIAAGIEAARGGRLGTTRLNRGIAGRGRRHFSDEQLARMYRYQAYYPDVDFSLIGFPAHSGVRA